MSVQRSLFIKKGDSEVTFIYGPNRARYEQTSKDANNNVTTTYYIGGGTYERVVAPNGKVTHKNYIKGGGETVAIIAEELKTIAGSTVKTYETKYLHRDAINSVDLITNNLAEAESYQSFRPFGERKAQIFAAGFSNVSSSTLDSLHKHVNRGFGGHEELASVGLVHMNGRVYDAKLGRFASADPHIQAPHNTQSYNRYTYVLNNPLKYADPSGFFFKKIFKALGITKLLSILPAELLMVASIAAAVLLGPGGAWAIQGLSTITQGAIAGAVSGFIGSGGDLKAAVVGGLTGAAFAGIGDKFSKVKSFADKGTMSKLALHGLTGGASSVANGGKFGPGFLSAGLTQAMSLGGGFEKLGVIDAAEGWEQRTHNAVVAGVVGGTASVVGGGKFSNGAQTAAMSRLFNDVAHAAQEKNRGGLWDAVKEGGSAKAGPGAGLHLKEAKAGPLKVGGGVVFGSGGVGLDSEGLSVWGESTADAQLSFGRFGGRAYIWDIDIDSSGVNNIDTFGGSRPEWDWSIGVGGTITPYSFEVEYNFQPLIDYFRGAE